LTWFAAGIDVPEQRLAEHDRRLAIRDVVAEIRRLRHGNALERLRASDERLDRLLLLLDAVLLLCGQNDAADGDRVTDRAEPEGPARGA
jgi:hypothetical protein